MTGGDYLVSRIVPRPDRWYPVETYAKLVTYSGVPTSEVGGDREELRRGLVPVYWFIFAKRECHVS